MNAGMLRSRLTLQRPVVTRGALNQEQKTWEDVATVWARIREFTGRELVAAQRDQGAVDTEITIRYRRDVLRTWRGVCGTAVYEFVSVTDTNQRHSELVISAVRVDGRR